MGETTCRLCHCRTNEPSDKRLPTVYESSEHCGQLSERSPDTAVNRWAGKTRPPPMMPPTPMIGRGWPVAEAMTSPATRAGLLTVDDVARSLACSTRSVYRLSDSGRMPRPLRIGGMVRWSAAAVDAWLADGCPDCRPAELRAGRHAKATRKNPTGPVEARRG